MGRCKKPGSRLTAASGLRKLIREVVKEPPAGSGGADWHVSAWEPCSSTPPRLMIWPSCWPPFWSITPNPGPGRATGPPTCPSPAAGCPGFGGWCGLIENGAYEGRPFPIPTASVPLPVAQQQTPPQPECRVTPRVQGR
jgi:hypothetical protein